MGLLDSARSLGERIAKEIRDGTFDLNTIRQVFVAVPTGNDARTVAALKQNVDQLTGATGSVLDRAVTLRDLLDEGVITVQSGSTTVGTGTSTVVVPSGGSSGGSGVPSLTTAPTPSNLIARSTVKAVFLQWDIPLYANAGGVQVWRATSNALGLATQVGATIADMYVDTTSVAGTTYYYWVRAILDTGDTGAFNAVSGTSVTAGRVDNNTIEDLAVDTAKIADLAVSTAKIADANITTAKIASLAVDTGKIANLSVTGAKIANATIVTANIGNAQITDALIGGVIKSSDFDGTVTGGNQITGVGTTGWAIAKGNGTAGTSKIVVDAAYIRGQITTSQIQVGSVSAAAANNNTLLSVLFTSVLEKDVSAPCVSFTSTGGNVAVTTHVNVSVTCSTTTITAIVLQAWPTIDGSRGGLFGSSAYVLAPTVSIVGTERLASFSVPLISRYIPSAGSHTYGVDIAVTFYTAAGGAFASGSMDVSVDAIAQENKV